MRFCSYLLLLYIAPFFTLVSSFNYIVNGGFEDPVVPVFNYIATKNITGWNGSYKLMNMQRALGYNQYINLQEVYGQYGYLQQTISLPS